MVNNSYWLPASDADFKRPQKASDYRNADDGHAHECRFSPPTSTVSSLITRCEPKQVRKLGGIIETGFMHRDAIITGQNKHPTLA